MQMEAGDMEYRVAQPKSINGDKARKRGWNDETYDVCDKEDDQKRIEHLQPN